MLMDHYSTPTPTPIMAAAAAAASSYGFDPLDPNPTAVLRLLCISIYPPYLRALNRIVSTTAHPSSPRLDSQP